MVTNGRFKRKTFGSRASKYKHSAAALRSKKVAAARQKTKTVTGRKRQIVSNTRKLLKLADQRWGPVQECVSSHVAAAKPLTTGNPMCFHINNFHSGAHGPKLYQYHHTPLSHMTGTSLDNLGNFAQYSGVTGYLGGHDQHEDDTGNIPNGPTMKMLCVDLEFQFKAFTQNRHIRVDIVRQKTTTTDFWEPQKSDNYLPATLSGFTHLAGFGANEIDRKTYEVVSTKRVYINSKGKDSSLTDNVTLSQNTTGSIKTCKIRLNLNKVQKQLTPSINQTTGLDNASMEVSNSGDSKHIQSNWSFDNINPKSNYWCIISADDDDTYSNVLAKVPTNSQIRDNVGDATVVQIVRRLKWRDERE